MKKFIFLSSFVLILTSMTFSSGYSVGFGLSYNHGISDFFEKSQNFFTYNGLSFVEKKHNRIGLGFNVNVRIPVTDKISIIPGFNYNFGHQVHDFPTNYEESNVDPNTENMTKKNYYFYIYSGELNISYDLLVLKNGWNISALVGLNYNYFKADNEMLMDTEKYWGLKAGIGIAFLHLKRFGFQVSVFYRMPFNSKLFSYFGGDVGVLYRFK